MNKLIITLLIVFMCGYAFGFDALKKEDGDYIRKEDSGKIILEQTIMKFSYFWYGHPIVYRLAKEDGFLLLKEDGGRINVD